MGGVVGKVKSAAHCARRTFTFWLSSLLRVSVVLKSTHFSIVDSRVELIVVLIGIRPVLGERLAIGPSIDAIIVLKHEVLGVWSRKCKKWVLHFGSRSEGRVCDLDGLLMADTGNTSSFTIDVRPIPVSRSALG